jgi:tetratricopeptide (TPR) repeat protein
MQHEIASAVTQALQIALVDGIVPQEMIAKNSSAYALYLEARGMRRGVRSKFQAQVIVNHFRDAIKLDPAFAPAWAELSRALIYQFNNGYKTRSSIFAEARESANQAIRLNPNLAAGHVALGCVANFLDWNWLGAEVEFRRALELEPHNADVLSFLGGLSMAMGRVSEARVFLGRAVDLDPFDERYYVWLGDIDYYDGKYPEAEIDYRKSLEIHPGDPGLSSSIGKVRLSEGNLPLALELMQRESDEPMRIWGLSLVYQALGRRADSDSALAELELHHAEDGPIAIAEVHAYRGEIDQAFDWIDRAYLQRDNDLLQLKIDPWFKKIEPDPRFKDVLRRMKLPE